MQKINKALLILYLFFFLSKFSENYLKDQLILLTGPNVANFTHSKANLTSSLKAVTLNKWDLKEQGTPQSEWESGPKRWIQRWVQRQGSPITLIYGETYKLLHHLKGAAIYPVTHQRTVRCTGETLIVRCNFFVCLIVFCIFFFYTVTKLDSWEDRQIGRPRQLNSLSSFFFFFLSSNSGITVWTMVRMSSHLLSSNELRDTTSGADHICIDTPTLPRWPADGPALPKWSFLAVLGENSL